MHADHDIRTPLFLEMETEVTEIHLSRPSIMPFGRAHEVIWCDVLKSSPIIKNVVYELENMNHVGHMQNAVHEACKILRPPSEPHSCTML